MIRRILALTIVIATAAVSVAVDMGLEWSDLQRQYFANYLFSGISSSGNYRFLFIIDSNGWRIANDHDVVRGGSQETASASGFPFELSEQGRKQGGRKLEWREFPRLDSATAHEWLQKQIYENRTPFVMVSWPIFFSFFIIGLLIIVFRSRRKLLNQTIGGRILRGSRLATASDFNSLKSSDGLGFEVVESQDAGRVHFGHRTIRVVLRVRKDEETSHFLLMGDSGTGKSSLIRQLLTQIRMRGESAVVYDPALEFTPHFYIPSFDLILNPVDKRMPFWSPSEEVCYPAEAAALAGSLFPDKPRDNNFFIEAARKIFVHLLRYRPSPQELTHWMRNIDEIDMRVSGTELEAMIRKSAASQRAAVQGTLNQAAAAFQLLPAENEANGRWSAAAWAKERKGWIFLPTLPILRESLRPLLSAWLDSLILRLMETNHSSASRVWLIVDELSSLQRLPQLPTAITESRKSNISLVIGFQGRSQLETVYGSQAEAMLSQPMTKVFLRTSEPNAAEWISRSIGEVEVLRCDESRTRSVGFLSAVQRSTTSHVRRSMEPLVLASTIASLDNLSGYVKSKDLVVPARFCYMEPVENQPGFLPRQLAGLDRLVLSNIAPVDTKLTSPRGGKRTTARKKAVEVQRKSSQLEIFE